MIFILSKFLMEERDTSDPWELSISYISLGQETSVGNMLFLSGPLLLK